MKQTMMGLLALMIAMLLSLNVQRASVSAKRHVIDMEMETIAAGIALEMLDYAGSKPFDAATAIGTVDNVNELTPLPFSTGGTYADADDLDDFHQIQPHTLSVFAFDFEITCAVAYVDATDPEVVATSQTFAKKIIVTVSHELLQRPVQISQVYTYP